MNQHLKEDFRIDASWPEKTQDGTRDLANIRMQVRGATLTRVAEVEKGINRDFLRTSGVSLALWFADNWWRLRWEAPSDGAPSSAWRCRHELNSANGGSLWPPTMIHGTGRRVVFAPSFGQAPRTGPIRFLETDQVVSIDGERYERVLDSFFNNVLDACPQASDGKVLKHILEELSEERGNETTSRWRRLEARLGFDTDEAPTELVETLRQVEDKFGEGAIEEAANASASPAAYHELQAVLSAAANSKLEMDFGFARGGSQASKRSSAIQPWELAEDTASELRIRLGLGEGPLLTSTLCDFLHVRLQDFSNAPAGARSLRYGARVGGSTTDQIALQSQYTRDRRFEVARMIGDVIWSEHETLGVISRAKTDRQRFQRAFAQSFLVPVKALLNEIDYDEPERTIPRVARTYEVHPNVLKTMLVNKNVLPRETIADRLEAA